MAFDSKNEGGFFLESLRSFLGESSICKERRGVRKTLSQQVQMRYNFHRSSFRQEIRWIDENPQGKILHAAVAVQIVVSS